MTDYQNTLTRHGACKAAVEWVGERDALTAWRECHQPSWLIWESQRRGAAEAKTYIKIAIKVTMLCNQPDAWLHWAENWLIDRDRSVNSATTALAAATAAAILAPARLQKEYLEDVGHSSTVVLRAAAAMVAAAAAQHPQDVCSAARAAATTSVMIAAVDRTEVCDLIRRELT